MNVLDVVSERSESLPQLFNWLQKSLSLCNLNPPFPFHLFKCFKLSNPSFVFRIQLFYLKTFEDVWKHIFEYIWRTWHFLDDGTTIGLNEIHFGLIVGIAGLKGILSMHTDTLLRFRDWDDWPKAWPRPLDIVSRVCFGYHAKQNLFLILLTLTEFVGERGGNVPEILQSNYQTPWKQFSRIKSTSIHQTNLSNIFVFCNRRKRTLSIEPREQPSCVLISSIKTEQNVEFSRRLRNLLRIGPFH